jgi:hypothetical protein
VPSTNPSATPSAMPSSMPYTWIIVGAVAGTIAASAAIYKMNDIYNCCNKKAPLAEEVFKNKPCITRNLDESDYLL